MGVRVGGCALNMSYMHEAHTRGRGRRLVRASATGMLGEYTHAMSFAPDSPLAIIYGPNGVGKTRFLETIDALANLKIAKLGKLPFESAMLQFADGWTLMVARERVVIQSLLDTSLDDAFAQEVVRELVHHYGAEIEGGEVDALVFRLIAPDGSSIDAQPIPLGMLGDGELSELVSSLLRHGKTPMRAPAHLLRRLRHTVGRASGSLSALPDELIAFIDTLDVRLIETHRLATADVEERAGGKDSVSRPTVEAQSDLIKALLDDDLSNSSRVGQQLDSTFPARMLEAGERATLSQEEIRSRLEDQQRRRARIEQLTPLGLNKTIPLPPGDLTEGQRSVLELYLSDADAKLQTFAQTVEKINMLEGIVNSRLLGKVLTVNADEGIVVRRRRDGEPIPLVALSSGEQHEIILLFNLLFSVRGGGLVLIDEPEISLHIAWQQKFIADVLKIADFIGFQFVIATHSPQIIDSFWKHAQRMGPESSPFGASEEVPGDA